MGITSLTKDPCIGYLEHPFVKETPWAYITIGFLFVRWYSAIH